MNHENVSYSSYAEKLLYTYTVFSYTCVQYVYCHIQLKLLTTNNTKLIFIDYMRYLCMLAIISICDRA